MLFFPLPGREWRLTQKFGEHPEVYAQFGMKGHNGLDFAPKVLGTTGIIVYAPHEGYITIPKPDPKGYGNHVTLISCPYLLDNTHRISTLAHFEKILVKEGYVAQGDPVGIMGKTGFTTGIHLHWTYKTSTNGSVNNYTNGFFGAQDVLKFCCYWNPNV